MLDVAAFEQELASDAFESTLEVVASLVIQLDRMDLAVGFLTNGTLKGYSLSSIPTGRGSHQMAAILEMLGRLRMRRNTSFSDLIKQNPRSRRGATWVYFGYHQDKGLHEMCTYCRTSNTPCVFFTWDRGSPSQKSLHPALPDIYSIQDLILENPEQA